MSAEKERTAPPGEEAHPSVDRDDVRVATNRCPYCHEDVAPSGSDVCRDCLARHHPACWTEGGGRCAACASEHVLRSAVEPSRPARGSCATPGCVAVAVARGGASDALYCAEHARILRAQARRVGVILAAYGVPLILVGLCAWLVADQPALLGLSAFGAFLTAVAGAVVVPHRSLPPLPSLQQEKGQ